MLVTSDEERKRLSASPYWLQRVCTRNSFFLAAVWVFVSAWLLTQWRWFASCGRIHLQHRVENEEQCRSLVRDLQGQIQQTFTTDIQDGEVLQERYIKRVLHLRKVTIPAPSVLFYIRNASLKKEKLISPIKSACFSPTELISLYFILIQASRCGCFCSTSLQSPNNRLPTGSHFLPEGASDSSLLVPVGASLLLRPAGGSTHVRGPTHQFISVKVCHLKWLGVFILYLCFERAID